MVDVDTTSQLWVATRLNSSWARWGVTAAARVDGALAAGPAGKKGGRPVKVEHS